MSRGRLRGRTHSTGGSGSTACSAVVWVCAVAAVSAVCGHAAPSSVHPAFTVYGGVVLPDVPPPDSPPTITSDAELGALNGGRWVAPVLYGGLGNVLFQLAAVHVYARKANVPCVTGFFDHWNRKFHTFAPWGGHPTPGPGLTLKEVFPSLRWMNCVPHIDPATVRNDFAFDIKEPAEYIAWGPRPQLPQQYHGYWFSHRYWHGERPFVVGELLQFNPAIERYLLERYGHLLNNETRASVSVHVRLGYPGEPATPLLNDRKFPPKVFMQDAISSLGRDKVYLIFADDPTRARAELAPVEAAGFTLVFIDENSVMSLKLMSMCQHHVLTSSTLSFWGAYLDPNQPSGGRTLLHKSFFVSHGEEMVPYVEWEVLP